MDTLTHGLLGAAIAALPLPRFVTGGDTAPGMRRAAIVVSVLAAELPDLDYLLPARDALLHSLSAHRGYTHSLLASPLIALAATLLTKLVYRTAAFRVLYARALLSVPLAHLLPDLWTGWGTRLWLPISEHRLALDWTMVIDPIFTLPLLVAAVWAKIRPNSFRRCMALGVGFSAAYLGARVLLAQHLTRQVEAAYPRAESVHVFPELLAVARWRYVAKLGPDFAAGNVALGQKPVEASRVAALPNGALPARLASVASVREAMAWARFPVTRWSAAEAGGQRVEIADLRYHLHGVPTLNCVITLSSSDQVAAAQLERGGSARDLWQRFRKSRE
jgi:inner membrane protein